MIVTTKTTKDKALHEKCIILLLAGPVLEHMFSGVVKNEINCLAKAVNMLGRADEKTTRKQLEYLWNMTFNEIYGNINAVKFFADKLRRSEYIPPKLVKSILTNLKYA
jgi:hypothetical protein